MHNGSIILAMIWMAVLSLLLFWLPLLGPLIAGLVGGKTAGSAGRGLAAALIPLAILCLMLFVFGAALSGLPVLGAILSVSLFLLIALQSLPLLIGALIGGALTN